MNRPVSIQSDYPAIPVIDIRDGGPVRHAQERSVQARQLRDDCLAFLPRAAMPLVPLLDAIMRRWFARSNAPYVAEIAQIGLPGLWMLNGSYQWGCTSLAQKEDDEVWLARTLDWPFSGLGRYAEVAQMRGDAGNYFSVTWPGYVGVLTAMAPGRFAACINQAPMKRRTQHPWLRIYDHAANAVHTFARIRHSPPDQLLRQAFETCDTYRAASRMLETTPVARPVIYTLIGCEDDERCVIERCEDSFVTREDKTSAANDWVPGRPRWEGRIGPRDQLTCSFAEAAIQSEARREALSSYGGRVSEGQFDWVTPPVLNPYTRLAVAMNPRAGILRVAGYEACNEGLPRPVTQVRSVNAARGDVICSAQPAGG
jgi:hypothetical protein